MAKGSEHIQLLTVTENSVLKRTPKSTQHRNRFYILSHDSAQEFAEFYAISLLEIIHLQKLTIFPKHPIKNLSQRIGVWALTTKT